MTVTQYPTSSWEQNPDGTFSPLRDRTATSSTTTLTKSGDIEVTTVGAGIILRSPDGTRWRVTVSDAGAPVVTAL